jgi:hypothetical protein
MTRNQVIRLAALANLTGLEQSGILENFERFAELVAAHEREECAKVLEDFEQFGDTRDCIAAIRARGQ